MKTTQPLVDAYSLNEYPSDSLVPFTQVTDWLTYLDIYSICEIDEAHILQRGSVTEWLERLSLVL